MLFNAKNTILFVILLQLGFPVLVAQERVNPLFTKGFNKYTEGNMPEAIVYFSQSLESEAPSPQAYFYRAMAYISLGELTEAIHDLTSGIGLDAKNPHYYFMRAQLHVETGEKDLGIEDCNLGIELDPDHLEMRILRGTLAYESAKYDQAVKDLHQAIIMGAEQANIYHMRAQANQRTERWTAAAEDYTTLINLYNWRDAHIFFSRGEALYHAGAFQAAIRDFSVVIKQSPDMNQAYLYRAKAHFCLEQYTEALKDLQIILTAQRGCEEAIELQNTIQSIMEYRL